MAWTLAPTLDAARNAAARVAANAHTITLADAGTGPSTLQIYDLAASETRTLLATLTLASPCAELVGGQIQLLQASPLGDIVLVTGTPTHAEWLDGAGALLASCTVSAEDGEGDLKISSRADGRVFAGGFITLTEGLIG